MQRNLPCKVVCLGDSITEGFGLEPEQAYPYLLQQMLGADYKVINAGVTAHCVMDKTMPDGRVMALPYGRTERYASALAEKGDIYLLLLGTNDAQDGMLDDGSAIDPAWNMVAFEAEFPAHYERILGEVKAAAPEAKIIFGRPAPVLDCIWPKHQQKYLEVILRRLDEVTAKHPECPVVDLQGAFLARGRAWMEAIYQDDGLHPGPKGAELIAEMFYNAVRKAVESAK